MGQKNEKNLWRIGALFHPPAQITAGGGCFRRKLGHPVGHLCVRPPDRVAQARHNTLIFIENLAPAVGIEPTAN